MRAVLTSRSHLRTTSFSHSCKLSLYCHIQTTEMTCHYPSNTHHFQSIGWESTRQDSERKSQPTTITSLSGRVPMTTAHCNDIEIRRMCCKLYDRMDVWRREFINRDLRLQLRPWNDKTKFQKVVSRDRGWY